MDPKGGSVEAFPWIRGSLPVEAPWKPFRGSLSVDPWKPFRGPERLKGRSMEKGFRGKTSGT